MGKTNEVTQHSFILDSRFLNKTKKRKASNKLIRRNKSFKIDFFKLFYLSKYRNKLKNHPDYKVFYKTQNVNILIDIKILNIMVNIFENVYSFIFIWRFNTFWISDFFRKTVKNIVRLEKVINSHIHTISKSELIFEKKLVICRFFKLKNYTLTIPCMTSFIFLGKFQIVILRHFQSY